MLVHVARVLTEIEVADGDRRIRVARQVTVSAAPTVQAWAAPAAPQAPVAAAEAPAAAAPDAAAVRSPCWWRVGLRPRCCPRAPRCSTPPGLSNPAMRIGLKWAGFRRIQVGGPRYDWPIEPLICEHCFGTSTRIPPKTVTHPNRGLPRL